MTTNNSDDTKRRIKVDIWADVACPWCYIGTRRLDAATQSFSAEGTGARREVLVEFHSFELAPDLPVGPTRSPMDYNTEHLGMSESDAVAALARVARRARAVGLELDFTTTRVANTVLAHQLIHFAKAQGMQREAEDALFAAYFTQGRNVSDIDDLADVAGEIGLDRADVRRSLTAGEHLPAVRADEALARSHGIHSVPFIVVDGRYGLPGAQGTAVIEAALERAWSEAGVA